MRQRVGMWKTPDISADGLKNFACIMMLLQTIGIAIVENGILKTDQYTAEQFSQALAHDASLMRMAGVGSVLQLLGGFSVPIFAFLLVERFLKTSSYSKYLLSLLVFAVLSEVPYDIANYGKAWDTTGQNALLSMVIALLMLYFLRMFNEKKGIGGIVGKILVVLCAVAWVTVFRMAFGLCIVLLAAVFYLFYTRNVLKTMLGVVISLIYVTGPLSFYGIWCYDESRKDRIPKYIYYAFYPVHLLVCGLISIAL